MLDILLAADGDLKVTDAGDIEVKGSIRQPIRIRLLWFLGEWRFAPGFGVAYFSDVFVKNPNLERVKGIIRDEAMGVNCVLDAKNIKISFDKQTRAATIAMEIVTGSEAFAEEVAVHA